MVEYIVDTSVLIDYADIVDELLSGGDGVIIPMAAIKELDKLKGCSNRSLSFSARQAIKSLKRNLDNTSMSIKPTLLDNCDDAIVMLASKHSNGRLMVLTNDFALEIRLRGLDIQVENRYPPDVDNSTDDVLLPSEQVSQLFKQGYIESDMKFNPNQYVTIKDLYGSSQSAFARYDSQTERLLRTQQHAPWDVKPKNREQVWAIDALLDRDIPIVILTGMAGTGKNYLTLAVAFEMVLSKREYEKIFITRPNVPVGRDIGYLPGSKDEKVLPWLGGVLDNVDVLLNSPDTFYTYIDRGVVEIDALTFIRGRSLRNTFIIIDETENMSPEEVKVVLTRVADGSKIVFLGDSVQIDNHKYTSRTCGLTYLVERARDTHLAAHVHLVDATVRSNVADWAARNL